MTAVISRSPDTTQAWFCWSALACAVAAVILWIFPWLFRVDLYSNDATQHIYWLYRYADPTLFPGDPSVEYFGSYAVAPWGYRTFYAMLAPLMDVTYAAEAVSAILLAVACFLAWKLGKAIAGDQEPQPGELLGLLSVATLILLLPVVDLLPAMGFQRTIALPVTLWCLWALIARQYQWVGVSWLVAALVYPIVVPVLGLTAGIVFLNELVRDRRMPPYWVWNGVLGAAALAAIAWGTGTPDGVGPMVTYEQARAMPEFGPDGRQALFGTTITGNWFYHHRTGLGWSPKLVLLLVAAVGALQYLGFKKLVPPAVWIMAAVGVSTWFLARLTLFHLYLPNRHSRWALAAFAIVALAGATYALASAVGGKFSTGRVPAAKVVAPVIAVLAPFVVAAALLPSAMRTWRIPVDADLEKAYAYLEQQPAETLIAAHPDLADPIPLRTQRSVLASSELSISFMLGYNATFRPRLEASLRAAYATSWDEFDRVLAPFHVNAFVSAPSVWSNIHYSPPLDVLVQDLKEEGEKQGFVMQSPPAERILFRSGDVYVIRVNSPRPKKDD